jgi:uncharacterized protein
MNAASQALVVPGPVGPLEVLRDLPPVQSKGVVVIAHPHPLFGGTMHNKVVQTLARAYVQSGWTAIRFNFRGVGQSAGVHDAGQGEVQDLLAVVSELAPSGPLALAGFSFGAFVCCSALPLLAQRKPSKLVLVGLAASRFAVPQLPAEAHPEVLLIHGEQDDTVPLSHVLDWARPQALPVMVLPGVEHFFHGQLPLLKTMVMRHLAVPDSQLSGFSL